MIRVLRLIEYRFPDYQAAEKHLLNTTGSMSTSDMQMRSSFLTPEEIELEWEDGAVTRVDVTTCIKCSRTIFHNKQQWMTVVGNSPICTVDGNVSGTSHQPIAVDKQ